jgi:hypothetical protein
VLVGSGNQDVDVLARVEVELETILHPQNEPADVAGQLLNRHDGRPHGAQRDPAAQDLLVEVDQLDLEVGHGMRLAQQRPALLLLVVGQREGRVAVHVDLSVEQERLARRALPLLAAVHQHQALTEGGVEDRLVLVDLDLDPDGLELDGVGVVHGDRGGGTPTGQRPAPAGR